MATVDSFAGRSAEGRDIRARPAASSRTKPSVWIIIFLLTLIQPFFVVVGGVQLGVPRAFLLFAAIPVLIAYFRGKAGRFIISDLFMILYVLWIFPAAWINHGSSWPFNLMVAIGLETAIPYFMARILIRDAESMRYMFRCLLWIIMFLLVFAAIESTTNRNLLAEIYNKIPGINVFSGTNHPPRLGLFRADSVFEHPILYGVFCAIPFSVAWLALFPGAGPLKRLFWSGVSAGATFFALSSGALFAVIFQLGLMSYQIVFRTIAKRWQILLVGFIVSYPLLVVVMDSPPLLYLINNATLNTGSAWNRVAIWNNATANLNANPIFGIGFGDWVRPAWLGGSMDNYWLVVAVRFGYPGFILHVMTFLTICIGIARKDFSRKPDTATLRTAFLIGLGGIAIVLGTVHIWSAVYIMIMFLIGSAAWMINEPTEPEEDPGEDEVGQTEKGRGRRSRYAADRARPARQSGTRRTGSRYTRFSSDR